MKKKIKNILKKTSKLIRYKVVEPVYIPVLNGNLLEGRFVLIIGGTGGIGNSIAEVCLKNGASILVAGRNKFKLQQIKEKFSKNLRKDQLVDVINFDITRIDKFDELFEAIEKKYLTKKLDVLINCAGIDGGGMFGDTTELQFDNIMNTNLKGSFFLSQSFSNYLMSKKRKGNILNISSSSGNRPVISAYMYSKWGLNGLTKGLGKRLIKQGIVVNAIAPGPTATEMLGLDGSDLFYGSSPSSRFVDSIEIANLAVFLISDMGKMVVGETIYITGGCGTLTYDDIDY